MVALSVENISKSFSINHDKYEQHMTLRDKIGHEFVNLFKNKGLYAKDEFHALKNISFEVNRGDKIGLLGNNGAGKSTLLKILSRIISPTEGKIIVEGKISSLIEVGAGFHLELTGAENILLSGTILGMSKNDIRNKFDEIISFAELDKFIHTPVKRYSSGMQIRLAFSIAVHLIADIIILDEVLGVGDINFQKKCLGKISEITHQGKTLIFVSHDKESLFKVCNKGILLNHGKLMASGEINDVWIKYQNLK
jgi:lipopolysaccharide transport system ATP-binding protein